MTCALGGECLLVGRAETRGAEGVQGLSLPREPQLPHNLQQRQHKVTSLHSAVLVTATSGTGDGR